uniref:Uncharacterized protein n=1 Tax=Arundo donax TaxID=35708 RepID=A0A0A9D3P3_ARUDO
MRLRSLPPPGSVPKVIWTPGSTCAVHSLGTGASSTTTTSSSSSLLGTQLLPPGLLAPCCHTRLVLVMSNVVGVVAVRAPPALVAGNAVLG